VSLWEISICGFLFYEKEFFGIDLFFGKRYTSRVGRFWFVAGLINEELKYYEIVSDMYLVFWLFFSYGSFFV
jgi:hypothetical protein